MIRDVHCVKLILILRWTMSSMIINDDDDIYLGGGNSDISYFHPYLGK